MSKIISQSSKREKNKNQKTQNPKKKTLKNLKPP
jgi:hypothetical protein